MRISTIQARVLPNMVKSATKTLPQEVKLATTGILAATGAAIGKSSSIPEPPDCGNVELVCTAGLSF